MAKRKSAFSKAVRKASGISKAKRTIARKTHIPTTKSGRKAKARRIMTGGGCLIPALTMVVVFLFIFTIL